MHYLQGGKWSKMTKILTARTDNAIKNHWNSIMQKKIPTYQQKLTALIENIRHQSAESTMK
jgi:SLT domain-containing protein